jgi:hypothetical protein
MLGDKTIGLCKVLQQRRDSEFMVDAQLGCSTEVVKDVMMDEYWCDKSVYECLGEVR